MPTSTSRQFDIEEPVPPPRLRRVSDPPNIASASQAAALTSPERDTEPRLRPVRAVDPPHLRAVRDPAQHRARVAFNSTSAGDVPSPDPVIIQKLALYAFEVLEGARSAAQLGAWVVPAVTAQLMERRATRTERRTLYKDNRRVLASPGPVHLDRPTATVAEATVVLHADRYSSSVALRFEHQRDRWRVTELTIL